MPSVSFGSLEGVELLSVVGWEGPCVVGATMVLPQEVLVVEATKPGLAKWELPTVLKFDLSPISADIYWAEKKEEKYKQTYHSRKKRMHLHGWPQGQASKKQILEADCLVGMQIYQS